MKKAIVLLSGGQDSTTCLYWAIKHFDYVECVSFFYNQKHNVEQECAKFVCDNLGIKLTNFNISGILAGSSLTDHSKDVNAPHEVNKELPSSFVPARNLVFLSIAAGYAYKEKIDNIITGVCETDFSGYPDCRNTFIESANNTINLALGTTDIKIHTPLMYLDKGKIFELADELGALQVIIEHTHTCYNGNHTSLHEWGYGCGECPSCNIRRDGFVKFKKSK